VVWVLVSFEVSETNPLWRGKAGASGDGLS
jgi:hypothetical protein